MEVTQEAILSLLIEGQGKVKNADLLSKFKVSLNCADPAEKKRSRDLFKTFVNALAVVKEIDDVKCIVLRKKYHHLLKDNQNEEYHVGQTENEELPQKGEHSPVQSENTKTSVSDNAQEQTTSDVNEGNSNENEPTSPTEFNSPVEQALFRSKFVDFKLKRSLHFNIIQSSDTNEDNSSGEAVCVNKTNSTAVCNKPYALPLRMPPSATRVQIQKLKGDFDDLPGKLNPDQADAFGSFRNKRRSSLESVSLSWPQQRRSAKSTKPSEEPKEPRFSSTVPLELSEHEWLVKSASGHWSQVYGLLLRDNQLAEKRDFMSGFTALHWAAKCGNSEMVAKIIEISRQGGVEVDINAKTHGGYTPLHIAALHNQELILEMLADEFGADASVRDNCGKKAYHYLHEGISERVRELLGEPQVQQAQENVQHDKEELDLFPDLSKGLYTISRLFQPHVTGLKKKHKQRPGLYSLSDDPGEDREEGGSKQRVVSDGFM